MSTKLQTEGMVQVPYQEQGTLKASEFSPGFDKPKNKLRFLKFALQTQPTTGTNHCRGEAFSVCVFKLPEITENASPLHRHLLGCNILLGAIYKPSRKLQASGNIMNGLILVTTLGRGNQV